MASKERQLDLIKFHEKTAALPFIDGLSDSSTEPISTVLQTQKSHQTIYANQWGPSSPPETKCLIRQVYIKDLDTHSLANVGNPGRGKMVTFAPVYKPFISPPAQSMIAFQVSDFYI